MAASVDTEYTLWSVGSNCFGSGPFHKITKFTKPKIKKIVAGKDGATFIVLDDNTFIAFGSNKFGQLGLTTQHKEIKSITCCNRIKIENIFSGITAYHAFKLTLDDNKLYASGWNRYKQLGIKTETDANAEWTLVKDLPIKHKIKDISAAYRYTIILTENGEIFQCGKIIQTISSRFEKIDIDSDVKFKEIKCGQCHTLLIDTNDELWSLGMNNHGQLGLGHNNDEYHPNKIKFFSDKNIKISKFGCGADHNIIIDKENGRVYCWGDNKKYQCGSGSNHEKSYNEPQKVNLFALQGKIIVDIKAGRHHNVAKSKNGKWYLWGNNQYNQCLSYLLSDHKAIQMPREFKSKLLGKDQQIIDIIPGDDDTKVVTKAIPLSQHNKNKKKKGAKSNNGHQNNVKEKVIDLTEDNEDNVEDPDQDENEDEDEDDDLENEEKKTIEVEDDDEDNDTDNGLFSKQEMKSKENEWNLVDADWKSTWPKHRCQKVLDDESKESEDIKDNAKMYLKYWQSMEHYNENSNNSENKKTNKRKRKHIDDNSNNKNSSSLPSNKRRKLDSIDYQQLYEKEKELNERNKSKISELEQQINKLKEYKKLYGKLQIVTVRMRDRALNGREPRREYTSSKCEDGIERTDAVKAWKKELNEFYQGIFICDHNVKITEWETKLKKFLEINKDDRDFTNPYTTFKKYRFNDIVEKFVIKGPNRIPSLIDQEGIRVKLDFKDKAIPKGIILGRYVGIEMTVKEWNTTFVDSHQEFRNQQYLYSFDIEDQGDENEENEDNEEKNDDDIKKVIIDPLEGGKKNLPLLYLNDCRKDIWTKEPDKDDKKHQNCAFLNARVNGWPQVFIVSTKRIPAGIELLIDYGTDYGVFVNQNNQCQEMIQKQKKISDETIAKYLGTKLYEKHNGAELYDLCED